MARTHGLKNLEAKFLMYIAMSQIYTGITKDAKANMNRSIALYEEIVDKDHSWSDVNDLIYTLGETMDALCVMGDYRQAATLIPNILKANSQHEQLESQAPPGAIDMYKAFVHAQCMEVYQQIGDKVQAAECYRKCLSTDYAKSPEGVALLTHYQLLTGDYQQALHNIQTAKRIYQQKRNTESEYYADRLLVDEMEALTLLGRYKEAAGVGRQIIALKDTLFKRKQQDDAQELAVIYETGEKEAQLVKQAAQLRENRMILFLPSASSDCSACCCGALSATRALSGRRTRQWQSPSPDCWNIKRNFITPKTRTCCCKSNYRQRKKPYGNRARQGLCRQTYRKNFRPGRNPPQEFHRQMKLPKVTLRTVTSTGPAPAVQAGGT